VQYHQLRRA